MYKTQLYEYNIEQQINNIIQSQKTGLYYYIPTQTIVFKGYNNDLNEDLCLKHNLKVLSLNNEGGLILSFKNDLNIGYFSTDVNSSFNEDFSKKLIDFLMRKNLKVYTNGNDILIDNKYKVASYSSRRFGDIYFYAFHISYDVDLDLIKTICTKPMEKIPKGLKNYGIYFSEIIDLFDSYVV